MTETPKTNIETVAEMAHVDPARVARVQANLRHLRQNGALVKVHCDGLSGIFRKASNSELGREDDSPSTQCISPGRIRTIPEAHANAMVALREAARALVDKTSFDITGFRPWRYIKVDGFAKWLEAQTELETQFEDAKSACISSLAEFEAHEVARTRVLAQRSWRALWANAAKRDNKLEIIVDGFAYVQGDYDDFEARMLEHVQRHIPSDNDIMAKMRLHWSVGGIETPATYLEELTAEEDARTSYNRARREAHQAAIDAIATGRQLSQAEKERDAELQAMHNIVAERIRSQLAILPDPGVEMIEQVRLHTGQVAAKARHTIETTSRMYKGTSVALNGMVERFDTLDNGDTQLEVLIDELKARLADGPGGYQYPKIADTLHRIEKVCQKKADEKMSDAAVMLEVMALPPVRK